MQVLIVDDEPIAISILEKYIRQIEGLEVAGTCRGAVEAFNFLQKIPVDLLLLDIEMPQMSGLAFLKSLQNPPTVILTTAYRDYALEGFELAVADYLLKPISFERFLKAIQKVRNSITPTLPETPASSYRSPYLYFKSGLKMVQVFLDEILFVESLGNYARIHLASGSSVVTYQKMVDLVSALPAADFIRIHRSYIVRRDKVRAFTPTEVEVGGRELPVGGQYKSNLMMLRGAGD